MFALFHAAKIVVFSKIQIKFKNVFSKIQILIKYVFYKIHFLGDETKNPAVSSGILCKQFRRLMMNYFFLLLSLVSSISLSFLSPFISA